MHQLLIKGRHICKVSGILFDKDGTLINSEPRLLMLAKSRKELAKKFFQQEKYTPSDVTMLDKLLSKAYGLVDDCIDPNGSIAIASRSNNLISTATIFCLLGKSWSKSVALASEIFDQVSKQSFLMNPTEENGEDLLPGIVEFLKESKKRKMKLGIISNDSRDGIQKFLEINKLVDQFSFYWSSEDIPPKPNPNAIKQLCKIINLNISECALIGDSDTDLKMAKMAGSAVAIGYTAGWKKLPLLYEHDHLISHWNELSFQ